MKNQKGITLIALIITIIVMLILVGVSVSVALNSGLFKSAQGAAKNTQTAIEKETELSNGTISIGGIGVGIDQYVEGMATNQESKLKVGDYVSYTYSAAQYTTPTGTAGVGYDGQSFSSRAGGNAEITEWRVLSTEGGAIKLIGVVPEAVETGATDGTFDSADNAAGRLTMYGEKAYLNGPNVLNKMCETLYSGNLGTARSIKTADISMIVGYNGTKEYTSSAGKVYFSGSKTIGDLEEETSREYAGNTIVPDGRNIQDIEINFYGTGLNTQGYKNEDGVLVHEYFRSPLNSNSALWYMLGGEPIEGGYTLEKYRASCMSYWLADSVDDVTFYQGGDIVKYCVRCVNEGSLARRHVYNSNGAEQDANEEPTLAVVPIVTLSPSAMIDINDTTKDGQTPETAWVIK